MPVPPNVTCATAESILALPYSVVLDTTEAPADPSVPDDECGSGDSWNAVWYTWTAPLDGSIRHVTLVLGGNGDSQVTIFSGTCGSLVLVPANAFDSACAYGDYLVEGVPSAWDTPPGTTYYFLVTSYAEGGEAVLPFTLALGTPSGDFCATLTCAVPPPVGRPGCVIPNGPSVAGLNGCATSF